MIAETLTLEQAADRVWDAVVIGAGPAGSVAARELARRGARVLLADRAVFPRRKACGGCLNASALSMLRAIGLGRLITELRAAELRGVRLTAHRVQADIPLPTGATISRETFDAALIRHAIEAGAAFLPGTTAQIAPLAGSRRHVALHRAGAARIVQARVVLVADGLQGRSLSGEPAMKQIVRAGSRVGVGAIIGSVPASYRRGVVTMACGDGGYVGVAHLEDGRCTIAAALDPVVVRRDGGPGRAVAGILDHAGLPDIPELVEASWQGTPPLTRRRFPVAATRLFVLGDAAGYVEPFTGEGIAWAVASAVAVAPLALQASRDWHPRLASLWTARYRRVVARRQRACRMIARGLRHAGAVTLAARLLSCFPRLAVPVVERINRRCA